MSPVAGLVLNYRDPLRTAACVKSLIDAGIPKVLVFDNSGQVVGRMTDSDMTQFGSAEVELVVSESNLGFAVGANLGFGRCSERWPGHWVLLVNNDALVPPELPERLSAALSTNPAAATAFPMMLQDGARFGWTWYQPWLGLISSRRLPGSFQFASGCCQLVAPERVGPVLFDEAFFMYGEDVELAWRLKDRHQRQLLVEDCTVVHEGSASSRRGSLFYETLLAECHLKLARKLSAGRPGRYVLMLGLRAISLPIRALLRSVRSRSLAPLKGLVLGAKRVLFNNGDHSRRRPLVP